MNDTVDSTYFFNNNLKLFQTLILKNIPEVADKYKEDSTFKIWNPSASKGHEALSLMMGSDSKLRRDILAKFEIFASDKDQDNISYANKGTYSGMEVQRGLPIKLLLKYFEQLPDKNWHAVDKIKSKIKFELVDLSTANPFNNEFHIIFGPSVFKDSSKVQEDKAIEMFKASLKPGGHVFTEVEAAGLSASSDFEKKEYDSYVFYELK
jgi:chemotaxis protein methyltransferase CheR